MIALGSPAAGRGGWAVDVATRAAHTARMASSPPGQARRVRRPMPAPSRSFDRMPSLYRPGQCPRRASPAPAAAPDATV
jgi:hypothetical protein